MSIRALVPKIYSPTKLCDVAQMAIILRPVFPASRVQHISDMHSKFALRPHHVSSMADIQSAIAEIRRGIKKKIEVTGQNILSASAKDGHNKNLSSFAFVYVLMSIMGFYGSTVQAAACTSQWPKYM